MYKSPAVNIVLVLVLNYKKQDSEPSGITDPAALWVFDSLSAKSIVCGSWLLGDHTWYTMFLGQSRNIQCLCLHGAGTLIGLLPLPPFPLCLPFLVVFIPCPSLLLAGCISTSHCSPVITSKSSALFSSSCSLSEDELPSSSPDVLEFYSISSSSMLGSSTSS